MSKLDYEHWISQNFPTKETSLHRCREATKQMQQVFPELTRVCGFYRVPGQPDVPHWWLLTSDNQVIDPTKAQFWCQFGEYLPLPEQPTGKCYNCGELLFGPTTFCNDACAEEAVRGLS